MCYRRGSNRHVASKQQPLTAHWLSEWECYVIASKSGRSERDYICYSCHRRAECQAFHLPRASPAPSPLKLHLLHCDEERSGRFWAMWHAERSKMSRYRSVWEDRSSSTASVSTVHTAQLPSTGGGSFADMEKDKSFAFLLLFLWLADHTMVERPRPRDNQLKDNCCSAGILEEVRLFLTQGKLQQREKCLMP